MDTRERHAIVVTSDLDPVYDPDHTAYYEVHPSHRMAQGECIWCGFRPEWPGAENHCPTPGLITVSDTTMARHEAALADRLAQEAPLLAQLPDPEIEPVKRDRRARSWFSSDPMEDDPRPAIIDAIVWDQAQALRRSDDQIFAVQRHAQRLARAGHGTRVIARILKISRGYVQRMRREGWF